jgi:hypothetical protein
MDRYLIRTKRSGNKAATVNLMEATPLKQISLTQMAKVTVGNPSLSLTCFARGAEQG